MENSHNALFSFFGDEFGMTKLFNNVSSDSSKL